MKSTLSLITCMALAVYMCRAAGFTLGDVHLTAFWERFFRFMPLAVFATLFTSGLVHAPALQIGHGIALLVAGVVMWRTRQVGLSVLVGLVMLWLLAISGAR
ncbi:MAG: AzlD domain-containing protein [Anaerolineae bacterium]|nr:AzlD domain-containing protein [Anaerolineae bacterium]